MKLQLLINNIPVAMGHKGVLLICVFVTVSEKKFTRLKQDYNFIEIISKYAIEDYIILILSQKENNFNALMKSNLNNKSIIYNRIKRLG